MSTNKIVIPQILQKVFCGSLESSDCLIIMEPNPDNKIDIFIKSPFIRQFGAKIKQISLDILKEHQIVSCKLIIQDQGAIDEVLKARIVTALRRAQKYNDI
ncbi:MAG: citrate lyase acyl carrier protein [Weeping tea tree witches'-broom phytoplasma]|uniref:citrate lyase acyl carrier protein n=1 Tax=Candidatus Phytoplasma melaleucae TaxID=2982630 RepID=UPI00293A7C02|nr:citrate lyase acyl carrier protein [Weeping tea tree witches'-broom phytoplasma]